MSEVYLKKQTKRDERINLKVFLKGLIKAKNTRTSNLKI
jgi:hypothetical protein